MPRGPCNAGTDKKRIEIGKALNRRGRATHANRTMSIYLEQLTLRLATGADRFPAARRQRHRDFLRSAQNPDGGFSGREGGSDLYYTGFALRGLALVEGMGEETAARAAQFLRSRLSHAVPMIDLLSLLYGAAVLKQAAGIDPLAAAGADWQDRVAEVLAQLRRDDGGFAKTPNSPQSSTYYTFLAMIAAELIDRPITVSPRMVSMVQSRRRDDGGFVEFPAVTRSATNPTAAAVAILKRGDALDLATRRGVVRQLAAMQTGEGGLRANTRIPVADLLSTFTGLLTLVDLEATAEIDMAALERYAESLEHADGGFHAAAWDQHRDVEYTFYGLGTLALLAPLGDPLPGG